MVSAALPAGPEQAACAAGAKANIRRAARKRVMQYFMGSCWGPVAGLRCAVQGAAGRSDGGQGRKRGRRWRPDGQRSLIFCPGGIGWRCSCALVDGPPGKTQMKVLGWMTCGGASSALAKAGQARQRSRSTVRRGGACPALRRRSFDGAVSEGRARFMLMGRGDRMWALIGQGPFFGRACCQTGTRYCGV
jgi:hypothetical protein